MKTNWMVRSAGIVSLASWIAWGGAGNAGAQDSRPLSIDAPSVGSSMGPAFSFQGQLKVNGAPYTGTCDLAFALWDSQSGGTQIGVASFVVALPVTNGLFTTYLNSVGELNPAGGSAFEGDARWLDTGARCPAGSGSFITLGRQLLYSVPYAQGLLPGTRMLGDAYQTLKIQNKTTQTGNPAGVTGEVKASVDGVGVYGSNEVTTSGATGMGVWGRTYSPSGIGVKGTGLNGAIGVYAETSGVGVAHPAVYAVNNNTGATQPAGIAVYAVNNSVDATIVVRNTGNGAAFRALNPAGSAAVATIMSDGKFYGSAAQLEGDLIVGGQSLFGSVVTLSALGSAGTTALCRNASNLISTCSSSARYKSKIADLGMGLDTVAQLRPVTFEWNATGEPDLGFVAEEVDRTTPLLASRNEAGQVEGVKYDRISAVLVKAMQEQQDQITDLKTRNTELDRRNTELDRRNAALEARLAALEMRLGAARNAGQTGPASRTGLGE